MMRLPPGEPVIRNGLPSFMIRTWTDGLTQALALVNPPDKARDLFNRYRDAFSEGFREAYAPTVAVGDIRVIEGLSEQRPLGVDFHHRLEEEQQTVGLKVWSFARPLPLSERVPVLENMAGPPMSIFSMQSSNEAPFATVASNG